MRFWSFVVCLGLVACVPEEPVVDAGSLFDAGSPDAGELDAGLVSDAGVADAGTLNDAGLGNDAGTRILGVVGTNSGVFDRAQHGIDVDGGVYVEAHFGGDPACPTASSPTPSRTLIIAGLRAPAPGAVLTYADGLRVTLLDFNGQLTMSPFVRATSTRAVAVDVRPGVSVSYSVEASFDGGSFTGQFVAPHCASLDG